MMDTHNSKRIRLLCTVLVAAVLVLSIILVVAVCGRAPGEGGPEETTRRNFWDMLPGGDLSPEFFPETIDWEDMTFDFPTGSDEPNPDDPFEETSGEGQGDRETTVEPEWPTLPADWETLPEEWETLPADWGVELPEDGDVRDLADELVGISGSLGMPQGALGAGIASQLTMMELLAEQDDRLYLKMQSFGAYNGRGWEAAEPYTTQFNGKYSAVYLPHLAMNRVDQERGFTLWINPVMDVRVIPYFLTTSHASGEMQYGDVRAGGSTDQPYTLFYRHYAAYSVGDPEETDPYFNENRLYVFERLYRSHVYNRYTTLDATTEAYMNRIIEEQGFDRNDPEIIEKVAAYMQSAAVYNLNYNQRLDQEPNVALAFLDSYKEGVCRHYATAATLLYRALGIPARYTVGFAADVTGGEVTAVKGMDAHAWVEVYEDGFGWRYVEVTGSPAGDGDDKPQKPILRVRPVYMEKKYDGEPLVHPGTLEGLDTYVAMGYTYEAEVDHDFILRGSAVTTIRRLHVYDPEGRDVTREFEIFVGESSIRIYYETLFFSSRDETKPYDGIPLTTAEVLLTGGQLPEGCTFRLTSQIGSQTAVGTGVASYGVQIWQENADGTEEDVTEYFNIYRYYGALTVTPATLTLKAADAEKVYDGTPLTASTLEIVGGSLAERDTIASYTVEGSRTRVGRSDNVITEVVIRNAAGEDVTQNYIIETVVGTLRVTAR